MGDIPRIDDLFFNIPEDSGEIMRSLRDLIFDTIPGVTMDWAAGPCFHHHGPVCSLLGFPSHVSLLFFRGSEMSDVYHLFSNETNEAGHRVIEMKKLQDIDENQIRDYIREAFILNEKKRNDL